VEKGANRQLFLVPVSHHSETELFQLTLDLAQPVILAWLLKVSLIVLILRPRRQAYDSSHGGNWGIYKMTPCGERRLLACIKQHQRL
jgi:hypothetical protein